MTANQLVIRVIDALELVHIPYMLVGSYSSNAYGSARSTQDADFVLQVTGQSLSDLFKALLPDLEFDPQMRLESITATSRYVGKHPASGFKIELFLTSNDAHDRARFSRRTRQPFLNRTAYLPTAEDVVIQKLRWFHLGRRAKDLDDAKNVIAAQLDHLDLSYLRQWCDQHGSRPQLDAIIDEVEKLRREHS